MDFATNLLNVICYLPLVGALVIVFLVKREQTKAIKWVATVTVGLDFVVSIPLWFLYDPQGAAFQFVYQHDWIPSVGVRSTSSASTASRCC